MNMSDKDLAKIKTLLWDTFDDLKQKGYMRDTLASEVRKDFTEILRTSNRLFDAFNMLFEISDFQGKLKRGRNKQFVKHNEEYGFTPNRYANLLFSESICVFLRNVELFRCCFLLVLKTKKRNKCRKRQKNQQFFFFHGMGIGQLLNGLVQVCGKNGKKIQRKTKVGLRNGLTHGLFWIEKMDIVYSKDITLAKKKRRRINLLNLWKEARKQSMITQCLIEMIPEWYEKNRTSQI